MQMNFQPVTITEFSGPDGNGTITATHTVSFSSNIIGAGAALQDWKISYGSDDHHLKTCGAGISNVSWNGTSVTFTVSLTLIDGSNNKISSSNAKAVVLVIASTE
jgi:hypothetical protein